MLLGVIFFLLTTGLVRANPVSGGVGANPELARRSRYLYVAAALALPALALAASAIARRWRGITPIVVLVMVIGIPGNIAKLADYTARVPGETAGHVSWWNQYRRTTLILARVPIAERVARGTVIASSIQGMTIGWLLDATAAGKVSIVKDITTREADTATLTLALQRLHRVKRTQCHVLSAPEIRSLAVGATFTIATGKADVSYLPSVREASQPLQFVAPLTLQAVVIPLQLRIAPVRAKQQTLLCD